MRIYGDADQTSFKTFTSEPGMLWGENNVLMRDKVTTTTHTYSSIFGNYTKEITTEPKVYLHISGNFWSSLTGALREYCLPWRWKVAYLEGERGSPLKKILVCTSVRNGDLSARLKQVVGQGLFVAGLAKNAGYEEILRGEFLRIPKLHGTTGTTAFTRYLFGFIPEYYAETTSSSLLYPIYRVRGVFSLVMYYVLRTFSSEWREIILYADKARGIFERVLIQAAHEKVFADAGFTKGK